MYNPVVAISGPKFPTDTHLDETNGGRLLTEALTAHVEAVSSIEFDKNKTGFQIPDEW